MDNFSKLRQMAGIQDINYELDWLQENATHIHERRGEFILSEADIGPFLLENGDIKIFNYKTNKVTEAKKVKTVESEVKPVKDDAPKKDEILDKPVDKELKKEKSEVEKDKSTKDIDKHEFPTDIKASIDKRVAETEKSLKDYKLKNTQYIPNDGNVLPNVIDELNKIKNELDKQSVGGFTHAQLIFQKLSSPITNLFPPNLITFLAKNKKD